MFSSTDSLLVYSTSDSIPGMHFPTLPPENGKRGKRERVHTAKSSRRIDRGKECCAGPCAVPSGC